MPLQHYPFVSLCTPTFNRRHFFPILFEMFKLQSYPKNRMEWIIIDDGTDTIRDLVESSGIKQIRYYYHPNKLTLGAKRNLMHTYCKGSIIVYVDDDDYFPPERVEHSVESLLNAKNGELIAGSSEIYLYFKDNGLYKFGPYGPNHATAGTFAFKRELLKITKYDETKCLAEEAGFLKQYTIPLLQLNPFKTILVFPHGHNTFDKNTLLHNNISGNVSSPIKQCTDISIDHFIKGINAELIKDFFINKMHTILETYAPGEPTMKPDVLQQTLQIQINRNHELLKQCFEKDLLLKEKTANSTSASAIMIKQDDGTITPLSNEEVCQRLMNLEKQLADVTPIIMQKADGIPIPLTNQQACDIIKQQQEHIIKQNMVIQELQLAANCKINNSPINHG
jgi:glycosyltransferase involved in cell wall biosynthesis